MEEYKKCFEDYEISNFGNLRKNGIIINGSIQNRGYRYFQISRGRKRKNYLFHHLVAEQFIGLRPDGLVIDHIDRNKLNNNVSNLRYISFADNLKNCDRYRDDILETDKRLRANILGKESYRRGLVKEGKEIKNRDKGTGSILQTKYKTWHCILKKNKIRICDKTFKTKEEAEAYLQTFIIKNY
jgi:hypothetical protein